MKYKTEQERIIGYKDRQKRYYLKNKEKLIKISSEWRLNHLERYREYARKRYVKRYVDTRRLLTCKECYAQFKVYPSRVNRNGNFCSQDCSKKYVHKHRTDPEIIKERIRINQREYWRKRNEPRKLETLTKRQRKLLIKVLKKIVLVRKIKPLVENKCQYCGLIFKKDKIVHKFCSRKCSGRSRFKPNKEKHSSKGIKKNVFEKLRAEYNYTCPICGKKEPFLDQYWPLLTQDHIIPRSKGGRKRAVENIQPLCWNCNIRKSDKLQK